MIVNIADLNVGAGKEIPFAFEVSAEDMDAVFDDCAFEGVIAVKGKVVNTGTCYRAEGKTIGFWLTQVLWLERLNFKTS